MKSPFHFSPALPVLRATAAALVLVLAGCGQKGPLYLPKPPPPHPVRNTDAAGTPGADGANVTTNAVDMSGAPEMSVVPRPGAGAASSAK